MCGRRIVRIEKLPLFTKILKISLMFNMSLAFGCIIFF